ncbi:MAG: ribonuclease HII [Saprospiraceae bacterium]|nr:ribonuclease HII [Saprospiraceae bacterium]MBP7699402.1 ribonuclease HII [Saprospiraceae bacterium]
MLRAFLHKELTEAGCDEAGRGCLAGPVFAAAVILPNSYYHPLLNDSKVLSEAARYALRTEIEATAVAYSVAYATVAEIDAINILQATYLAMHRAIAGLSVLPQMLLIDGNRFKPYADIQHTCIIKGDAQFYAIAAASILAKTYRDDYMKTLAAQHPTYQWEKNKGYPTVAHRRGILQHGTTVHHRKSFTLLPENVQGILF